MSINIHLDDFSYTEVYKHATLFCNIYLFTLHIDIRVNVVKNIIVNCCINNNFSSSNRPNFIDFPYYKFLRCV